MTGLLLNFFECEFLKQTYEINFLEFKNFSSKGGIKKLREENPNFAFIRDGEKIFYWEKVKDEKDSFNGKPININSKDSPKIFSKIFQESLITFLKENLTSDKSYKVFYDKYANAWEITSKGKNLLSSTFEGLAINQQFRVSTFFITLQKDNTFGILISSDLRHRFLWANNDFEHNGIDTTPLRVDDDGRVHANKQSISYYLSAKGLESEYQKAFNKLNSNAENLKSIISFFGWIKRKREEIYLPDGNKLVNISKKYLPYGSFIKSEELRNPNRYYYQGNTNTQRIPYFDEQVKKYKPYSYSLFESGVVKIGVMCPKDLEGTAESFTVKLKQKLENDLHIKKVDFSFCFLDDSSPETYKENLYDPNLLASDLNLIVVTEEHLKLPHTLSPYYLCKAKYIGNGIPTQDIQVKNLKSSNKFLLNNLSLNIYAKLGGTAWTVEKEDRQKEEIVIGVGSTTSDDKKNVLGIAQVFLSDGRYLVAECAPLSTFENYSENLKMYLKKALKKAIDNHIDKSKEFRIIFHLYKSSSYQYEIKAIEDVIEEFKDLNFKYALAHIGYGHNFRLFRDDGNADVTRGTYLKLSSNLALLNFVKTDCLPLRIDLDNRSTFKDLYYVSKQVYWFSSLSHRSYFPAKKTVTITYPSLMARITEELKQVEGWDYDRLEKVSEKLWFI